MPGQPLSTDAFVLLKRPPADKFQTFSVFSPTHGALLVLQRLAKSGASAAVALDLFDEASLILESSNQGQTWFAKEVRLLTRHPTIGRSYDALRFASALAALVARNPVAEETRASAAALLRAAFAAFAIDPRPDIVWLKSLYRFARGEGYPIAEHWFPTLPSADREDIAVLLNQPLAAQTAAPPAVARLTQRLENYLRGHTEILLD